MMNPVLRQILDETPQDLRRMMKKHARIVMRIKELMAEKDMSQKELAEKIGKKPSEISKWLSAGHNLTLRSVTKLEIALDEEIINVPVKKSFDSNKEAIFSRKTKFTVTKNASNETEYTFVSTKQVPPVVKRLTA